MNLRAGFRTVEETDQGPTTMKVLYFDCFSGVAGDMMLGALLDAGLPLDVLRSAVQGLLPPRAEIGADRVVKCGVAATKFRLFEHADDDDREHGHHDHHQHAHHGHDHHHHKHP